MRRGEVCRQQTVTKRDRSACARNGSTSCLGGVRRQCAVFQAHRALINFKRAPDCRTMPLSKRNVLRAQLATRPDREQLRRAAATQSGARATMKRHSTVDF